MATKRKRTRKRKSESLKYKITAGVERRLTGGDVAKGQRISEEAKRHFRKTGEELDGVKIIGYWRNPDNLQPRHAAWKSSEDAGQSLRGFYETIIKRTGATLDKPMQPTEPAERKRLDELFGKRSAAAKRGAVTRRTNADRAKRLEASRKRSRAAKKGAATKAKTKQPGQTRPKAKLRILGGKKKK